MQGLNKQDSRDKRGYDRFGGGMSETLENPAELPIVDCHQHFWRLDQNYYPWLCDEKPVHFRYGDYSVIKTNYMPPDYRRDIGTNKVVKTVHEEAWFDPNDPLAETRFVEAVAAQYEFPNALVGAAWFARDDIEEVLAGHARSPLARGVRNFPAPGPNTREPARGETGSMDDPKWRRGFALLEKHGLSADIQAPWKQAGALAELAADFPRIQIIVVHTFLPVDRSADGLAGWRKACEKVAAYRNVAIKVSGLGEAGQRWSYESNGPVIRDAISIFGPERAMFASNYPVDRIVGTFSDICDGFRKAIADRPLAEQRQLLHDNAVRIYKL
jgi:predicted TIM-barrel fold metal-dependent hydrolase